MTRPLLLSLLAQQRLVLGESFRARYPHCWLVWEAGLWNVTDTGAQDSGVTRYPESALRDCLPAGDVLCFELAPGLARAPLPVGRASHNALVLNDATVSREHLLLRPEEQGGWRVEALPRSGPAWLGSQRLRPGECRRLEPGGQLRLGDAQLTFHDSQGFDARMAQAAAVLGERRLQVPSPSGREPG
jgi:hypothetical protein